MDTIFCGQLSSLFVMYTQMRNIDNKTDVAVNCILDTASFNDWTEEKVSFS